MLSNFLKSVMAGFAISVGGIIYLATERGVIGAFLFSIGLFVIYSFDFNLYTGKVCFIANEKPKYLIDVLIVYIGNLVGTVSFALLIIPSKLSKLQEIAVPMVEEKLSDTPLSTFIVAIMCGFMLSIAVLGYRKIEFPIGKHLALIMPVMVFIIAGFEHSIANLFYYTFAGAWSGKAVIYSLIIALGNLMGGLLIPLGVRFSGGEKFMA